MITPARNSSERKSGKIIAFLLKIAMVNKCDLTVTLDVQEFHPGWKWL